MNRATRFVISLFFGLFVGIAAGLTLADMNSPWWVTAIVVVAVTVLIGWLATKFWSLVDSQRGNKRMIGDDEL